MIIDIELIIIVAIILIVGFWFVWFKITNILNKKNYNPENDKGRQAEEKRRRAKNENGGIEKLGRESSTTGFGNERFREHEERILLPTTETIVTRKDSNSVGETSNSNGKVRRRRNPFRRRR